MWMMEYVNMTNMCDVNKSSICFSSKAIWFLSALVLLAIPTLFRLLSFGCRYFFPAPPPFSSSSSSSSQSRKKQADRNKANPDVSQPLLKNMADSEIETDNNFWLNHCATNSSRDFRPSHPLYAPVDGISLPLLEKTQISLVKVPRRFTYQSLVDATQNFRVERRMSIDMLGDVYKGQLLDTKEVFAIRRLQQCPYQGVKGFEDEVLLLSQANHPNLANLIGYSVEGRNRLLVYEYVSGGSLENHLHGNKKCLDWNTRMKISQGVANALGYLQNTMYPPIHHCYIEPANVWLDEEYTPKLSAYGVVRMYPSHDRETIPSKMFGSYLYAKSDYRLTNNITIQADIYGFGVFLLEIITGRKGFRKEDGVWLTHWVQPYLNDRKKWAEIVDPKLCGKFNIEEFYEAFQIARMCLEKQPNSRPLAVDLVTKMDHLVKWS